MRLPIIAIALATAATPLWAADDAKELQLKPKAAIASAPSFANAPFVARAAEPQLDLQKHADPIVDEKAFSCHSAHSLCYDGTSGRIVFKAASNYMPGVPGMKADG